MIEQTRFDMISLPNKNIYKTFVYNFGYGEIHLIDHGENLLLK